MLQKIVFVPELREGEQIEGWIRCVCSLYQITRRELLSAGLGLDVPLDEACDFDGAPSEDRTRFLVAALAKADHPTATGITLRPSCRQQFCPLCLRDDLIAKQLPRFPLAWSSALLTHCLTHAAPLMHWPDFIGDRSGEIPRAYVECLLYRGELAGASLENDRATRVAIAHVQAIAEANAGGMEHLYGFQQQIVWEKLLVSEASELAFPFCITPAELRTVVDDIATLAMSTFDVNAGDAIASRLSWELGPQAIFRPFKGYRAGMAKVRMVSPADVEEPGMRRTVIFCVMRFLLSLVAEVEFNDRDGNIEQCGRPAYLRAFRDLNRPALGWLAARMESWPVVMRTLMTLALPQVDEARTASLHFQPGK